ncbi:MAG: toll/interleukin-1 receptor domain-containing protein, partial [Gemmatimonadales bacterium]
MPAPPILEIYVLWHPDDDLGATIGDQLIHHFHGPAYAGLAGGAVEVYLRSVPWDGASGPPRPMPFMSPLPAGLPAAQITAVIPILGRHLARTVRSDGNWRRYLEAVFAADQTTAVAPGSPIVGVYTLTVPGANLAGSSLAAVAARPQTLPGFAADSASTLAREVAQAISQRLAHVLVDSDIEERLTVFISHTKRAADARDTGPTIAGVVRQVLSDSHLDSFFDAHDIQVGEDWESALDAEASRHALLMVRTDSYAGREWTQREVHVAKMHDIPIVCLNAVRGEEQRGSFLMDHVPVVACPAGQEDRAAEQALNRLVDEALKRALWQAQRIYLAQDGFDWLPVHAPEPVTAIGWLQSHLTHVAAERTLVMMHPDPPLGPNERQVIFDLCRIADHTAPVDILT